MRGGCAIWLAVTWLAAVTAETPIAGGSFRLRVLHTNDMHARFEEVSQSAGTCSEFEARQNRCYGGFARVAAGLQQEMQRAERENITVVSLNAGDSYQGTVWYTVYKWRVVSHFLKMLKIDAMALGNHEFDDGIEGLTPFLNDVGIPVLAANIDFSGEPEMQKTPIKSSIVINRGGRKIGVIGYLTPDTVMLANTGKLEFKDEIQSLREEAKKLKKMGVDIIIALGHSGYEVDLDIAALVEDVDLVVGGHSHTFLYTGPPPDSDEPADTYPVMVIQKSGRKVAMVQAYAFTKYLGVLDLLFDERGELLEAKGNPIVLNYKVAGDPAILEEVSQWRSNLNATIKQGIGRTSVFLDASQCRFFECNLGNLITDAYINYNADSFCRSREAGLTFVDGAPEGRSLKWDYLHFKGVERHSGPFWTKAAIAIQQAGGIRTSINATGTNGTITTEDLITAMPFFSPLSIVRVKGTHLLDALEWSVARYDPKLQWGRGEFLQVSGLRVKFNMNQPSGTRLVSVKVRCQYCHIPRYQSLKMESYYDIIMPTFLYNGGDNFTMFKKHGQEIEKFSHSDTEVAMQYIRNRGVVYNGLEDRLIFDLDTVQSSSGRASLSFIYFLVVSLVVYF